MNSKFILPNENFIQFIWQYCRFDSANLTTARNLPIQIIKPGHLNTDSGPDFENAKLLIGSVEWHGSVEIHVKSSDWYKHNHREDELYENVILHVVWENDRFVEHKDGSVIPTLVLKGRVDEHLIHKYGKLKATKEPIPCTSMLSEVNRVHKQDMLSKVLMTRMEEKAAAVKELLDENRGDWEETTWQLTAKNFGLKPNSEPFFRLSKSLPVKTLLKHRDSLLQIEALLFGQAGFLDGEVEDPYFLSLKKEHRFLSHKYDIRAHGLFKHEWKFGKIRPAGFPTVRLAQLAALLFEKGTLFSLFTEKSCLKSIFSVFDIRLSDYWRLRYDFGKNSSRSSLGGPGVASKTGFVINTIVPLLVCLSKEKQLDAYIDNAVGFLEELPPENNKITRLWKERNMIFKNAADSQGGIGLFNNFCLQKKCLTCGIGVQLLNSSSKTKQ